MVSSCESAWHRPVAVMICPLSLLPTASWEFLTTLDYEWSIIRGRRPYRWSIWVRDDNSLRSGSGHLGGRQIHMQVW